MNRHWKIAVVKDTSRPMLGGHGLHVAFRGLPGVEIVAHVDSNTQDLGPKLAQTGAKCHYTTCEAMLEHETPNVVILCSRHPSDHLEQVRMIAAKGCHIYCEKPVSVFLAEADEMARLADVQDIKLGVAHPGRHDLGFLTMKRLVESGEIGTPLMATGRGKCDHRGGGEDLIVLGTHILDLQAFLFGAPHRVMAEIFTAGQLATLADVARLKLVEPVGPAVGDDVFASFRFSGGVRGLFESRHGIFDIKDASFDRERGPRHMGLSVVGTKGVLSLRFDDMGTHRRPLLISRGLGFPDADARFEEIPLVETRHIPSAEPLDYTLCGQPDIPSARWFLEAGRFAAWDLIRAIEEDRQPVSSIHGARLVVEMIQGIYASHLSGGAVTFPLVNRDHPLVAQDIS
jgi:predicted dehydrogenase